MAKKISKAQANYRGGYSWHRCINCTMFQKPNGCTAVEGTIRPQDLCKLFEPKKKFEEA